MSRTDEHSLSQRTGSHEGSVVAVACHATHAFSKTPRESIRLIAGVGVEGDAHAGETVKHRSRVARDPSQPNLRQVHLIHEELFAEVAASGFRVSPGDLGENVTTRGIDLLGLSVGTLLHLGSEAVVEVTGLRNPCPQIEAFQPGLLSAVLVRDERGATIRKSGIMGIVRHCGTLRPGDPIRLELPTHPHRALERV